MRRICDVEELHVFRGVSPGQWYLTSQVYSLRYIDLVTWLRYICFGGSILVSRWLGLPQYTSIRSEWHRCHYTTSPKTPYYGVLAPAVNHLCLLDVRQKQEVRYKELLLLHSLAHHQLISSIVSSLQSQKPLSTSLHKIFNLLIIPLHPQTPQYHKMAINQSNGTAAPVQNIPSYSLEGKVAVVTGSGK